MSTLRRPTSRVRKVGKDKEMSRNLRGLGARGWTSFEKGKG
jgi:hypothetical protein